MRTILKRATIPAMLLQLRREFMQELGISGAPAQRKTSHTG